MDRPFAHRGFMLDVSRHFMPVPEIRRLLAGAAQCGVNRMHWHLTDDQGWRLEILKYPLLTRIGAFRGNSHFGGVSETENNCGFYTQQEVRELVAYASSLGIEIIPEIEIPGHASAMLAAYPGMGCRRSRPDGSVEEAPYPYSVQVSGGIFPDLVCAGREETLRFLKDILDEVMALFPFPMVHIGGDEALKIHWRRCPDCRERMRKHSLRSEDELQRLLVLEIGEYLHSLGRETIVWNDVLEGGLLPEYFIVQQWLGSEGRINEWLARGGRVIVSDTRCWYFDYPYGRTDVYRIWQYPRIPGYAAGRENQVLGLEAPLWTERITNTDRAAFMLFPRLAALGLKAAGQDAPRWPDQQRQIARILEKIEALGLCGAPEAYWHMPEEAAEKDRQENLARVHAPDAMPYVQTEQRTVLLESTERFMREIGIPEDFLLKAGDILLDGKDDPSLPPAADGADVLIRQLAEAVKSRKEGAWKRFPENIWLDTMKCFPRFIAEHRRSYGCDGFDRGGWTVRQVGARLFRIGELEYELPEKAEASARPAKGACISLHIPSDARLQPALLDDSVRSARSFLSEYFPDLADLPMDCESWLLSPRLREWLPAGSRILGFQAAFDLVETDPGSDAALEWVFHVAEGQRAAMDPARFPEDTALQRKMKADCLSGGKPGAARGLLVRAFRAE